MKAPSLSLMLLEQRVLFEYGAFLGLGPLLRLLPKGDGHPVLVLPGFTGSDRSTAPLRRVLRSKGYWVHGWNLGANVGPHRRIVRGIQRRIEELHDRHKTKVSLVGWSLGGIYARELARDHTEAVRQVITLGSPFRLRDGDRSSASRWYDMVAPRQDPFPGRELGEENRPPLSVPSTAIYTRTDGIVRWHACIETDGPQRESIEVRGTHSGLGFNLAAIVAMTDRLAQPEGTWAPFRPPAGAALPLSPSRQLAGRG